MSLVFAVGRMLRPATLARGALTWLLIATPASADDALNGVRSTWGDLRAAISAGDGQTAVSLMTPGSIDFFGRIMDLALHAEKAELQKVPAFDALWAIILRSIATPEALRDTPPDEFVARVISIDRSMQARFAQYESTVTKVIADGAKAKGMIHSGPHEIGFVRFELSDGRWRFDYVSITEILNAHVDLERARQRHTWDQTMNRLLMKDPNKPIPARIFVPPARRN